MNPGDSPYPRRGPCPQCSGAVLPDGVCTDCFNRRRLWVIRLLLLSEMVIGGLIWIIDALWPDMEAAVTGAANLLMFAGSAIGGVLPAIFYSLIVPFQGHLPDLRDEEWTRICQKCGRWLEPESNPWCPYCSGLRLRKLLLAVSVALPLLGIGACDVLFVMPARFPWETPDTSILHSLMLVGALGPIAAGLVWVIFGPMAGRRKWK